MRFILRLKHWQLFLITWGLPLALNIYSFLDLAMYFQLFKIVMIAFTAGVFGWVWAIATVLHKKLPEEVHLSINQFRLMFAIPCVYIISILVWINFAETSGESNDTTLTILPLIILMHLLSIVCILLCVRFAAKTLKSVELGRLAKFNDYAAEFFLVWFSPVGIWILQPRLNNLTRNNPT